MSAGANIRSLHIAGKGKLLSINGGLSMGITTVVLLLAGIARVSLSQPVYYPLGIGDQWTFTGYGPWYQLMVSKDTLMPNGKTYSIIDGISYFPNLQRHEGDQLYCYNFSTGLDSLFLDFTWPSGDTIATIVGENDTSDVVFHTSTINILGQVRRTWSLGEGGRHIVDAAWSITIADSIGIIELSTANATQRLSSVRIAGTTQVVTGVEGMLGTEALQFTLFPSYPNPFNPQTTIRFSLPIAGEVRYALLDLRGREIDGLNLGNMPAGPHQIQIDGSALSTGVYYYQIFYGGLVRSGKVMLLR